MIVPTLHYDDTTVSAMASQITSIWSVCSAFCSGAHQRKHQSSASLAIVREMTGHGWIHLTKGQQSGNRFHLMTSSCFIIRYMPFITHYAMDFVVGEKLLKTDDFVPVSRLLGRSGRLPNSHHCLFMYIAYAQHDDVIKWKHFPRYWPFVRGIHQSPVNFPAQRSVTRSFDVFFDLRLYKRLSKQSWGWWFETLSCPLWRHCNGVTAQVFSRTQISKTFGSPSSRHRSDAKVSDRCLIDVDRWPVRLPWLGISGTPLKVNGVPGNIQGSLTALFSLFAMHHNTVTLPNNAHVDNGRLSSCFELNRSNRLPKSFQPVRGLYAF